MSVNKAVEAIFNEHLTPGFYAGVLDKTVDKRSSFWREALFPRSQDIVHDKAFMFWHEMRKMFPTMMPTDIAPCDEGDYIAVSNSYERVMVSQGYWWLGFPIDCDFSQFLMPGENPYNSRPFREAVEDHMLDLRDNLFSAFDQKEEYWAVMMATVGEVKISPKGAKPYWLRFQRDKKLNRTITDPECMWCGDPKKDTIKHRPWDDFLERDDCLWQLNRGRTDYIVMNHTTAKWMKNAYTAVAENIKDASTLSLLLPSAARMAGYTMPPMFDGARLMYFWDAGDRLVPIYVAETTFQFCDPDTGAETCVNPLKDGKVYGYNVSATEKNRFNGRFSFGRITNFHSEQDKQKRFFHQHLSSSGKSWKHHGESAPAVMVECPNGSWCLDVCGGRPPKTEVK